MERIGFLAPEGFRGAALSAGLKRRGPDLCILECTRSATVVGRFTQNRFAASCVRWTKARLQSGQSLRAMVCNSGNANAANGPSGDADTEQMAAITANLLHIDPEEVAVASTGVIGVPLPMSKIVSGITQAVGTLDPAHGELVAHAIMTTDTVAKTAQRSFEVAGRTVIVGGMSKGSGMIHPNLATMFGFMSTDLKCAAQDLDALWGEVVDLSFNRVTVDGDQSTNDMALLWSSGQSGVTLAPHDAQWPTFRQVLLEVAQDLAKAIARDGEGATKFLEVVVRGAKTQTEGRQVARAVAVSPLVKTAVFGEDPNWGRILVAVGNSEVAVMPERVGVRIGGVQVAVGGVKTEFDEAAAKAAMAGHDVLIEVDLGLGACAEVAWSCDLSYDYVRINGRYRT